MFHFDIFFHEADGGGVWGVGLSPDGRYVATSGNDNTVKIWKLDTCDFVASLIGHTRRPMCVVFTFDGRFLISGGDDRQIRIWGVQDGKCRAVLAGHQDNVRALAVTHDGLLASASDDNTISTYNISSLLLPFFLPPKLLFENCGICKRDIAYEP